MLGDDYRPDLRAELRAQLTEIGVELVLGEPLRALPPTPATELGPFTVTTESGREITADMWFQCFGVTPGQRLPRRRARRARAARTGSCASGPSLQVDGLDNVFADRRRVDADAKMAGRAGRQAHLVAENIRKLIDGDHDAHALRAAPARDHRADRTEARKRPTPEPRRARVAARWSPPPRATTSWSNATRRSSAQPLALPMRETGEDPTKVVRGSAVTNGCH